MHLIKSLDNQVGCECDKVTLFEFYA